MFKEINGFENYSISEDGLVMNNYGKILKSRKDRYGYDVLQLSNNNKKYTIGVHRLIGIMFISNPNNYPQIDHIDRDKLNNNLINLRWCNASMNGMNRGIFKNNKLKEKYITEHESQRKGKYYYYYLFKITGIIEKSFSCNLHLLEDVIKYRDDYLIRNKDKIIAAKMSI